MSGQVFTAWFESYHRWSMVERAVNYQLSNRHVADPDTAWAEAAIAISGHEQEMMHALRLVEQQASLSYYKNNQYQDLVHTHALLRRYVNVQAQAMYAASGATGCRTYRGIITGSLAAMLAAPHDESYTSSFPSKTTMQTSPVPDGITLFADDEFEDGTTRGTVTEHSGCTWALDDAYMEAEFAQCVNVVDVTGDTDLAPWESVYALVAASGGTVTATATVSATGVDVFPPATGRLTCGHVQKLMTYRMFATNFTQLWDQTVGLSDTEVRLMEIVREARSVTRLARLRYAKATAPMIDDACNAEVYGAFSVPWPVASSSPHRILQSMAPYPMHCLYSAGGAATAAYTLAYYLTARDVVATTARMIMIGWAHPVRVGHYLRLSGAHTATALANGWWAFIQNTLSTTRYAVGDEPALGSVRRYQEENDDVSYMLEKLSLVGVTVAFPSIYGRLALSYVHVPDSVTFTLAMTQAYATLREAIHAGAPQSVLEQLTAVARDSYLDTSQAFIDAKSEGENQSSEEMGDADDSTEATNRVVNMLKAAGIDAGVLLKLSPSGEVESVINVETGEPIDNPDIHRIAEEAVGAYSLQVPREQPDSHSAPSPSAPAASKDNDSAVESPRTVSSAPVRLTPMLPAQKSRFMAMKN